MNKIIRLYNRMIGKYKEVKFFEGLFDACDDAYWVVIGGKKIIGWTNENHAVQYANEEFPNIPWK